MANRSVKSKLHTPIVLDGERLARHDFSWPAATEAAAADVLAPLLDLAVQATGCSCALLLSRDNMGRRNAVASTMTPVAPYSFSQWWKAAKAAKAGSAVIAADGAIIAVVDEISDASGTFLVLRDPDSARRELAQQAEHLATCLHSLIRTPPMQRDRLSAYEALFEIGRELQANEVDTASILELIVGYARLLLGTGVAWLGLIDSDSNLLEVRVSAGTTTPGFTDMALQLGTGIGGLAIKECRPVCVFDHRGYHGGASASSHRILDEEGIVSVLCAPLILESGPVGALWIGTRERRRFSDSDASLLSTLAGQAAIAIKNAQLYETLSQQNQTLQRIFANHRLLTEASLSGAGTHHVAFELARLIERDVVVALEDPTVRCHRYDAHAARDARQPESARVDEKHEGFVADVSAGRIGFGTITALGGAPLDPVLSDAVEYGATIIALEMIKEQSALEVEWRLQGEMLEEMLKSSEPSEGLRARAERLGVDLTRPRRLAVLKPGPSCATTSLLELVRRTLRHCGSSRGGLLTQRGEKLVVAVPNADAGCSSELFFKRLQDAAAAADVVFSAGVSAIRKDLRVGLREAESALELGASTGHPDVIMRYEDLGPLRFLLDAPDASEMVAIVREHLGALAEQDANRNSELLKTLQVYLENGGHQPATAARCHIHISTLKYRLGRVKEILGRSITDDPEARFELSLAFAVLRILEVLRIDPFAGDHAADAFGS